MSYLVMAAGVPNFGQAVISFWFKVQQDTIERVASELEDFSGESRPPMLGCIPLLIFGKMFTGYRVETVNLGNTEYVQTIKSFIANVETVIDTVVHTGGLGSDYAMGDQYEGEPSYIGIQCFRDGDTGDSKATLRIRLQTPNFGTGQWAKAIKRVHSSNYTSYSIADSTAPQGHAYDPAIRDCSDKADAGEPLVETTTNVDVSEIWTRQGGPDSIEVGPTSRGEIAEPIEVEPDTWHHLLFSFNVMQATQARGATAFSEYACSPTPDQTLNELRNIINPCKVWIAFDDENRTGGSLADPRFGGASRVKGLGANDVAPYFAIATTFETSGGTSANEWHVTGTRRVVNNPVAGMPTYTLNPGALPSGGHSFGIPGTPELVEQIRHVEMSEFQMFLDETVDTGVEANRRAFIDFVRDKDGNPVVDEGGFLTLKPAAMSRAATLIGKQQEIILHGVQNWQDGTNTGSLADFVPTGQIDPYKPDPFLKT